ncbi:tweedlealpha [Cochliomyia hominivorax]
MRIFLILLSTAALSSAKPQYNYGTGISGSFGDSSGNVGGLSGLGGLRGISGAGGLSKFQGGYNGGFSLGGGSTGGEFSSAPASSGTSSAFGGGSIGSGFQSISSSKYNQYSQQHQQTTQFEAPFVHKQFITVAAPEDNENLERTKHLVIGRPQKNYRVVFIKAPSSSNANVKLSAEYAPQEEKTVIYVLSKKDSSLEVGDIATPAPTVPSKPEVFFIKYKTEEEAQHAQKQIQAEYDKIEGTSEHTDAGIAPQQSVVGIFDGAGGSGGIGIGSTGNAIGSGSHSGLSTSVIAGSQFGTSGSSIHSAAKSSAYLPPSGH